MRPERWTHPDQAEDSRATLLLDAAPMPSDLRDRSQVPECGVNWTEDTTPRDGGQSMLTGKLRGRDLTGCRFDRLEVIGKTHGLAGKERRLLWICKCECGQTKLARSTDLVRGFVRSCGCLHLQAITVHSMSRSPEYRVWNAVLQRCGNPNNVEYPRYGGSGIRVCEAWQNSFEAFYQEMGPRPSSRHQIDRIDGSRGYEPGNCRWATPRENTNNRSNTRTILFDGENVPLSELAQRFGVPYAVFYTRIVKHGWSLERSLSEPCRVKPRRKA